jgi:hypothetical protein
MTTGTTMIPRRPASTTTIRTNEAAILT